LAELDGVVGVAEVYVEGAVELSVGAAGAGAAEDVIADDARGAAGIPGQVDTLSGCKGWGKKNRKNED
jgi:hypothetical protein